MKLVFRRVACLGLILILCFQAAFAPRAKAVAPLVLTAVAAVGVGGLAAAVAAYFKANGVDMTMYNIASGVAAQEAMSNLIQEYLNDTRDGMDIDDYVSSIGLADKVFYKYYRGAADWVAAQVQTVISALGVATIFDPILNWFRGKYDLGVSPVVVQSSLYVEISGAFYSVYVVEKETGSDAQFSVSDSDYVSGGIIFNSYNFSVGSTRRYDISGGGYIYVTTNSTGNCTILLYDGSGVRVAGNSFSDKGYWPSVGVARRSDGKYTLYTVFRSAVGGSQLISTVYSPYSYDLGFGSSVSASQQEDDGTNRFPSTSVPDDFQLVIPVEISNAGTVQPVPPSTDTQEDQSDAITAAILDSQALNELSLSETPSVEAEDAQPTAAPTAVPTAEPTTEPTTVPTAEPTLAPSIPEEYTPDITEIFPFCIPFDFYLLFDLFSAEPEAPHFTIPFPIPERIKVDSDGNFSGQYEYQQRQIEIDFRDKPELEAFMAIFRRGELILFVAGLALVTRKFIRW